MKNLNLILILFCLISMGCSKVDFSELPSENPLLLKNWEHSIPYTKTQEEFKQDKFESNVVTVQFQVSDLQGQVSGLKAKDLLIKENGQVVTNFTLRSTTNSLGRKADIVFVIDDTQSMQPYVDQVKIKVADFVQDLAKTNIKASLCLVTFGDQVHEKCNSFVEDIASTPQNENLLAFLDALSRVNTGGGADMPENQLEALMTAAAQTPWHSDSQRLALLITDASFHYYPDNLGNAPSAPSYVDAMNSLKSNRMTTFAVAPDMAGYNGIFQGSLSLPQATNGKWYNFDEILAGNKDLGDVFNSIVDQLKVVYVATYEVDKNSGLDPSLPDTSRTISISASSLSNNWNVLVVNKSATMPNGRPVYKKKFKLRSDTEQLKNIRVMVNGTTLSSGFEVSGEYLNLDSTPEPGASILVEYNKKHLRDNLNMVPIVFRTVVKDPQIVVEANGVQLSAEEFVVRQVDETTYIVDLNEKLLSDADPLMIMAAGRLHISIRLE